MKKRISVLTALLCVGFAMNSFAGSWQSDSKGRWYLTDDYKYPVSQWKNIEGDWYYFNSSGYSLTGWQWVEGKSYFFNDGRNTSFKYGAMLRNTESPDGYELNGDGAWIKEGIVMTEFGEKGFNIAKTIGGANVGERADLFLKLNEYRKSKGLPEAVISMELMTGAQMRAEESAELFSHTRPTGQPFYTVGNISKHYSGMSEILTTDNCASTAVKIDSFKNSPSHNELMLQSEDYIKNLTPSTIYVGTGYYKNNGNYYVSMIFGHKK